MTKDANVDIRRVEVKAIASSSATMNVYLLYRGFYIAVDDSGDEVVYSVKERPDQNTPASGSFGSRLAAKCYIDMLKLREEFQASGGAENPGSEERRQIARRKADVENYEAREQLRLTTNALGLAINLLEHQAELQPWQVDALKITLDMSRETLKSK